MSDIQSQLQEIVPRAAIYKGTNKSIDSTVHKMEYVTYPSNLSHTLEIGTTSSEQKVFFLVSGNCLLDGKNSYFSVQLKTNKWTSCLSGDITSLFKRVTISLPSSGNQILEDIQEYNVLSGMIQYISGSDTDLETNWYSGQSSMVGNTREEFMETSRLELNWNAGTDGWRTYTFALNLSGLLQHSLYLPLFLFNGIKIELTMSSALEAFHWDPTNESDWESVLNAVNHRLPLTDDDVDGMGGSNSLSTQLKSIYQRGEPDDTPGSLKYMIQNFTYHASVIWASPEYMERLREGVSSSKGLSLFFNTFRFNIIQPESPYVQFSFTDQLQNLRTVLMCTLMDGHRTAQDRHSINFFSSHIDNFTFRIGSRIFHRVDNTQPALSYVNSLISTNRFNRYKANAISSKSYNRERNIHIFNFERVIGDSDTHSGLDTRDGKLLRLELQFKNEPVLELKRPNNTVVATLRRGYSYNEVKAYAFLRFTRMVNISGSGIGVSE